MGHVRDAEHTETSSKHKLSPSLSGSGCRVGLELLGWPELEPCSQVTSLSQTGGFLRDLVPWEKLSEGFSMKK